MCGEQEFFLLFYREFISVQHRAPFPEHTNSFTHSSFTHPSAHPQPYPQPHPSFITSIFSLNDSHLFVFVLKGHAKIKVSRMRGKLLFLFLGLSLLAWSGPHQRNRNGVTQERFPGGGDTKRFTGRNGLCDCGDKPGRSKFSWSSIRTKKPEFSGTS